MKYRMSEGLTNIGTPLKEAMERAPKPDDSLINEGTKKPEQEPVAWRETHSKVIKALAAIVTVHTPDKLFDLDAIPRDPVMHLVQQIKAAIDGYKPPQRKPLTEDEKQEPVETISDAFVFKNLNGIYGDPKHHKIPLTRCQIVEFGRKMFELGAKSSTSPKVEQEPVAWTEQQFYADGTPNPCALLKWAGRKAEDDFPIGTKFYTTPPQRTWVGLTPQERDEINEQVYGAVPHHVAFHHAIEAKLKELNT